ncbi:MAG: hypothetical protein V3U16_08225 [Candidatus Neomarinimicrobiota bacterium]
MTNNKIRSRKVSNLLLFVIALAGLTLGLTTVFAFTNNSNPEPVEFVDLHFDGEDASKCGDDEGEKTEAGHEMDTEDGKCGDGKCGDGKDAEMKGDHKCGDGKCGDGKDAEMKAQSDYDSEDESEEDK